MELTPHGQRQIDELAQALASKSLSSVGFELIGHTDQVGDAQYNLRLSLERANAIRDYLQLTHGIAPERLQAIGLGFSRLADKAHPRAPINRRVEVRRVVVAHHGNAATQGGRGSLVATPK